MAALSTAQTETAVHPLHGVLANRALTPDQVEAELTYLVETGVRPVTTMPPLTGGEIHRSGTYAPYRVTIRNARPVAGGFSLDREGFSLTRHDSAVANFFDDEEVRHVYYPEMARLVFPARASWRACSRRPGCRSPMATRSIVPLNIRALTSFGAPPHRQARSRARYELSLNPN